MDDVKAETTTGDRVGFDDPRWQQIDTAPRDGTLILVMDPDCGIFPMRWSPLARNPLSQPGRGIWIMSDGSMTWSEYQGFGPSKWMPMPSTASYQPSTAATRPTAREAL